MLRALAADVDVVLGSVDELAVMTGLSGGYEPTTSPAPLAAFGPWIVVASSARSERSPSTADVPDLPSPGPPCHSPSCSTRSVRATRASPPFAAAIPRVLENEGPMRNAKTARDRFLVGFTGVLVAGFLQPAPCHLAPTTR